MVDTITTVFKDVISFPTVAEMPQAALEFSRRAGLTGCVGAMDGCVIKCTLWGCGGPRGLDTYFCARKSCYGIILHAVVDARMRFRFVQYGHGASNGDSRVLQSSRLWTAQLAAHPWVRSPHYIVADSAYPMLSWLVRPMTQRETATESHRVYNNYVSRTRIVVEQSFGKLKKQWTAIAEPHSNVGPAKANHLLGAALVLHNLTIDYDSDNTFTEAELAEFIRAADTIPLPHSSPEANWDRAEKVKAEAWKLHVAAHPGAAGTEDHPAAGRIIDNMARRGAARVRQHTAPQ